MEIDIVTLFPEIALAPLSDSIMQRARAKGIVAIRSHQLRDWAEGKYQKVDDAPYGGGVGMVLKPEPLFRAVKSLKRPETKVLLMSPQGQAFKQEEARRLAKHGAHYIILCGHYEGVDHRVVEQLVCEEWCIGDYILTNGALAAAVVIDSIVRLLPGVLGDEESALVESFSTPDLLEAPVYTKPAQYESHAIPDILLSGHHAKIQEWRQDQALIRTRQNRPDLRS